MTCKQANLVSTLRCANCCRKDFQCGRTLVQVVAAVAESAQQQQDNQSLQIAASTLKAVVPAWISAGKGLHQLLEVALGVVDGLSLHRSILLLSALISALPQVRHPHSASAGTAIASKMFLDTILAR
jgi:hypothetical protein